MDNGSHRRRGKPPTPHTRLRSSLDELSSLSVSMQHTSGSPRIAAAATIQQNHQWNRYTRLQRHHGNAAEPTVVPAPAGIRDGRINTTAIGFIFLALLAMLIGFLYWRKRRRRARSRKKKSKDRRQPDVRLLFIHLQGMGVETGGEHAADAPLYDASWL